MIKFIKLALISIVPSIFCAAVCSATSSAVSWDDATANMFAQNNILFYGCTPGGYGANSSFKVDPSVNPWYAEGDVIRTYAGGFEGTKLTYWEGSAASEGNKELFYSTQDDPEMGHMQYVYAEQYDVTWNGGTPIFTKNGSSSTTKYYWLVLPDKVYTNATGETFLATFEKIDEPIHFIVLDVHAAKDQNITELATTNPASVACGEGCLGALYEDGYFSDLYNFTGGITSLHRLTGESKILLEETEPGVGGGNGCSGKNPTVSINGHDYMFPLSGATKDNYLHGIDETSVLSPMPCSNYGVGACHHDYVALDLGLRKQKIDGQEITGSDHPDLHYDDYYYYSEGVKVLAFVKGSITSYTTYSLSADGYQDKCASIMYHGEDGRDYWLGHMSYDPNIRAGDSFELGDVIGEIGPPPCAQGTQSHLHIHISPDSANDTFVYDMINQTYDALPEFGESASSCADVCVETSSGGLKDGGFDSVDEADRLVMEPYRALKDLSDAELTSKYAIPSVPSCVKDTNSIENCYGFSTWFLNVYTNLCGDTPCNPGSGKGDADILAQAIADAFNLQTGTEPRPYAIFSVPGPHTGVVLGVDQANDKIIIGEAGCESGFNFIGAHEYSLSSYTNTNYTYVYLDDHIKPGGL